MSEDDSESIKEKGRGLYALQQEALKSRDSRGSSKVVPVRLREDEEIYVRARADVEEEDASAYMRKASLDIYAARERERISRALGDAIKKTWQRAEKAKAEETLDEESSIGRAPGREKISYVHEQYAEILEALRDEIRFKAGSKKGSEEE